MTHLPKTAGRGEAAPARRLAPRRNAADQRSLGGHLPETPSRGRAWPPGPPAGLGGRTIAPVPRVHVVDHTPVGVVLVLEAARDFSERRAEMWPDVHVEHLTVHEIGETFADVTEGNPWPIGYVWERLRYDWSSPGSVQGRVVDSNLFKPGSTWGIWATPEPDGRTRVEVIAVRNLRGKGLLLAPVFPLGIAHQTVTDHLRHFLSYVEKHVRSGHP